MTKDQAVQRAGSVSGLAAIMGVTPGAVRSWRGDLSARRERQLRALRPEWFMGAGRRKTEAPALDRLLQIAALAEEIKREVLQCRNRINE